MNDLPEHLRDPMKVLERGRQIEEGGGLRLEQPSSKEMYLDAVDIAQLIDAHKREMDNGDDEPAIVLSKREADDTIEALKRLSTAHEPFPSLEHEAGGSRERGTSPNRSCGTAGQSGPASSLHDAAQPSAFAGAPMRVLEWPELSKSPDCPKPQRYDLRNTSLGYEPDYEMVRDEGGEWVRWDDIEPHLSTTQPPTGWQPIANAPKDGTMILTVVAGWQPGIYKWFEFEEGGGRWTPDPECFLEEAHFNDWLDGNSYEPTHWMPLPSGPTVTKEGEHG